MAGPVFVGVGPVETSRSAAALNLLPITNPSRQVLTVAVFARRIRQSTASAKARVIANALRVRLFDPEWTLPSLRDQNPLVWMAEVNGLLVDLRDMPREVQEIAFEKGMIPYIPADRE